MGLDCQRHPVLEALQAPWLATPFALASLNIGSHLLLQEFEKGYVMEGELLNLVFLRILGKHFPYVFFMTLIHNYQLSIFILHLWTLCEATWSKVLFVASMFKLFLCVGISLYLRGLCFKGLLLFMFGFHPAILSWTAEHTRLLRLLRLFWLLELLHLLRLFPWSKKSERYAVSIPCRMMNTTWEMFFGKKTDSRLRCLCLNPTFCRFSDVVILGKVGSPKNNPYFLNFGTFCNAVAALWVQFLVCAWVGSAKGSDALVDPNAVGIFKQT